MRNTALNLIIFSVNILLLFTCCNQIKQAEREHGKNQTPIPADALVIEEELQLEPPRTAEPPPPLPPPPPPAIPEESEQAIYIPKPTIPIQGQAFENTYKNVKTAPYSTFSIDVDNAAYSQIRSQINQGRLPYPSSVRIEEMINYFEYDYPQPEADHPFSVNTEMATCPWNTKRHLLHIGLQGKDLKKDNLPPSNLVFLLDVSGSMDRPNKLPLLKSAFKMLVNELRPEDKVAIVVYAGASGLVLDGTSGEKKRAIRAALNQLQAGGSTAGASGIQLAYKVAKENFIPNGNNRVILATDGDFNVGPSSEAELVQLIENKRNQGIFLSIIGFGDGDYQDEKMEQLADNGNGNYHYIDQLSEAKKVLVNEFGGTLYTIAKDVKLQLEFNPNQVKAYRLIGYENRVLEDQDFNDDLKDAGELGAGHTVTALYELILADSKEAIPGIDELKYQQVPKPTLSQKAYSDELLTIKLRYKQPDQNTSTKLETIVKNKGRTYAGASNNFKFSAAVAAYGLLLKNSKYAGNTSIDLIQTLGKSGKGLDRKGYRREFLEMVENSVVLMQ